MKHVIPLLGEFTNIKTVINSISDRYIKTKQRKALELLLTALCKDKGSALKGYVPMVIKQLNDDKGLPVAALKHQLIASRPDSELTINAVEEGSNTVEFLLNALGIAKNDKLQEKDQLAKRADSGMDVFSEGDSAVDSPVSVMSTLPVAPQERVYPLRDDAVTTEEWKICYRASCLYCSRIKKEKESGAPLTDQDRLSVWQQAYHAQRSMVTTSYNDLGIPVEKVQDVITSFNPTSEYFSLHQLKQLEALPDNEIAKTLFDMLPNQWCIEFMYRIYRADAAVAASVAADTAADAAVAAAVAADADPAVDSAADVDAAAAAATATPTAASVIDDTANEATQSRNVITAVVDMLNMQRRLD